MLDTGKSRIRELILGWVPKCFEGGRWYYRGGSKDPKTMFLEGPAVLETQGFGDPGNPGCWSQDFFGDFSCVFVGFRQNLSVSRRFS